MDDSKEDASVFRFPDVDLTIPRPERRGDPVELPQRSDSKDRIAMFGYLEVELGPVGTRTIQAAERPAWPVRPLDMTCMEATAPRPDVLKQIQGILPTFSPEKNSLAWCSVVDLVRSVGRSAEEVRLMGYDELARLLDFHGQRLRLERCDLDALVCKAVAAITQALRDKPSPAKRGKGERASLSERFALLVVNAPEFCIRGEIVDIAKVINCAPSSLYDLPLFNDTVRPLRDEAGEAPPQEVFDSQKTSDRRAKRAQEAEIDRIIDRIDAEG